jgi:hypothetical protein
MVSIELGYYLAIVLLTIFFALKNTIVRNESLFKLLWFTQFLGLSCVVRLKFDTDIVTYASSMDSSSLLLYYLKEPVVWLGQRYLYYVLDSSYLVFLIFDSIVALFLYAALRRISAPQYLYFSILLFFPFVLGMQNVYRQWVACILFLYSFSVVITGGSRTKSYAVFLLSVLSHNVAGIFLPLLFILKRKPLGVLVFYMAMLISVLGIYLGADTKSSPDTGANLSVAYIAMMVTFIVLFVALDKGIISKNSALTYKLQLIFLTIVVTSFLVLSSGGAERVSMFAIIVIYPFIGLKIESRIKQKVPIRIIFSLFGFVPIFLFGTSKFLVN